MPFVKGQSGNPKGRPKVSGEVMELLQELTPEAITTLAAIMRDATAQASSRVTAAMAILKKTLPDLASMEHSGEIENRYVMRAPEPLATEAWTEKHETTTLQ